MVDKGFVKIYLVSSNADKDSSWWLQDSEGSSAFYVDNNGDIRSFGNSKSEELGVRPVMRVKL